MPSTIFNTQESIDHAIRTYLEVKSINKAVIVLGCSNSALSLLLKKNNIPNAYVRPRVLGHISDEQIKATMRTCPTVIEAAIKFGVVESVLRDEIKHRNLGAPLSLLSGVKRDIPRPSTSLICEILKNAGPLMDTEIAHELETIYGKKIKHRSVSQLIRYARRKTGTKDFYIHGYGRKEDGATGLESPIWAHGPGEDCERPKQATRAKRRRISMRKSNEKRRTIRAAQARKSPIKPFDGLIQLAKSRVKRTNAHSATAF